MGVWFLSIGRSEFSSQVFRHFASILAALGPVEQNWTPFFTPATGKNQTKNEDNFT
jgi:hypothetical protein